MRLAIIVMVSVLSVSPVHAAWLKYHLTTLVIYGAGYTAAEVAQPGFGVIEIPGVDPGAIVWPAPLPPSSCGIGQLHWSKLSPGGVLPLLVRPELRIFRCVPVTTAADVRAVMRADIDAATEAVKKGSGTAETLAVLSFLELRACAGGVTANCTTIRNNNATLGGRLGTLAEGITFQDTILGILTDADAAITAFGF